MPSIFGRTVLIKFQFAPPVWGRVIQSQRKNTARDVIKEGTLEFAQPKLPPPAPPQQLFQPYLGILAFKAGFPARFF